MWHQLKKLIRKKNLDTHSLPLLERLGLHFFHRFDRKHALLPTPALNDEISPSGEAFFAIEKQTARRAGIVGALSAACSALAAFYADPLLTMDNSSELTWDAISEYWLIVGSVIIVATTLEIIYLYWDSIRAVHQMSLKAPRVMSTIPDERRFVLRALVRAALELPNPIDSVVNVDPHKETSKMEIVVAALVYKSKIALTNFILKALIKKLLGRVALRGWLEFIAIPITAIWNYVVSRYVMREAIIRIRGPANVSELFNHIMAAHGPLSDQGKALILRAVVSAIVRSSDFHPNVYYLYHLVAANMDEVSLAHLDDSQRFIDDLSRADEPDKMLALRILVVASLIDGKLPRKEKKLLQESFRVCQVAYDVSRIKLLKNRFIQGHQIIVENLDKIIDLNFSVNRK